MEQAERKHVIFVFVYSSKSYFYLFNFFFTMFKKNANFETIHHSQNNEFGFEKKKFLPQNNEVAIFWYTKTKEKTNIHFICFAFWQINATFSWKHELWITLSIISRVLAKCIHVLTLNKVIWHAYRWIPITCRSINALRYVF